MGLLLQKVITPLIKMLTRRGVLIEEMGQNYLAEPDANGDVARTIRPLQTRPSPGKNSPPWT